MKVRLENLTKVFPSRGKDGVETRAVDNFTYDIPDGKLIGLLGPSGCGKSTTLRMVAGFEIPTSGQILLNGKEITNLPPHKRPINTVFQRYALFPHLDVYDNVAFGLKLKRVPNEKKPGKVRKLTAEEIDEKVEAQKKKDIIEFRNKKRTSRIFLFAVTIYEIVETILVVFLLFLLSTFIISKLFGNNPELAQNAFSVAFVVVFIGGLVLGFIIFKKTVQWFIEKYKLEDKLTDEVLYHYKKQTKDDKEEAVKRWKR